jgi:hypothetical protein
MIFSMMLTNSSFYRVYLRSSRARATIEKLTTSVEAHPSKAVEAVWKSFLSRIHKRGINKEIFKNRLNCNRLIRLINISVVLIN